MGETLIFGPISVKFRSINSQLAIPSVSPCKSLHNSTFYHLKSLIALPIHMIRPANPHDSGFFLGGCHTRGVTPGGFLGGFRPCFRLSESVKIHSPAARVYALRKSRDIPRVRITQSCTENHCHWVFL
jgi:hypothetical protein